MIRAQELRIGNYVYDDEGTIVKIECLISKEFNDWNGSDGEEVLFSKDGDLEWSSPVFVIPLTEEWLLKLGFTKNDYSVDKGWYNEPFYKIELESKGWIVGWDETLGWYIAPRTSQYNVVPIKTVHQLQNLYFALTGEELTVK